MPNWLAVVLLVVAVIAAGMLRERWRLLGLEKWTATRGLVVRTPYVPGERPPMAQLATRFDVHGARLCGAGIDGRFDGVEVTLAEFENTPPGRKTSVWQTLIVWSVSGPESLLVFWPHARGPIDAAQDGPIGGSDLRVRERVNDGDGDPASLRTVTNAGLLVEGRPEVRAAWLTDARAQALEAWPHGGAFSVERGFASWRVQGLLTQARLEELLGHLAEARRILG